MFRRRSADLMAERRGSAHLTRLYRHRLTPGSATRALVTFLARIARDQRLALVVSHRPDEVTRTDPWPAERAIIEAVARFGV